MGNHYYNTTRVSGAELARYESSAAGQEERVLALFRQFPDRLISPVQVHTIVMPGAPRRSVARSLRNLVMHRHLIKTDEQVAGRYGRPNYLWRLNRSTYPEVQQDLLP